MQPTQKLLKLFAEHELRFVIIGGLAATVYGSTIMTEDIDICISFDKDNIERLLAALSKFNPKHRLIRESRPLVEDADKLSKFKNLYLNTDLGPLDVLSEIPCVGNFEKLYAASIEMKIFNISCRILDIESLIQSKREMSRPKDKETIYQLEAIKESTKK